MAGAESLRSVEQVVKCKCRCVVEGGIRHMSCASASATAPSNHSGSGARSVICHVKPDVRHCTCWRILTISVRAGDA